MGCKWIERMERIENQLLYRRREWLEKWAENKRLRGEKPKIIGLGKVNSKHLH